MHHIETVVAYWHTIRPPLGIPTRDDIEPARLFGSLSHMFITERRGTDIVFRVAGTSLCQAFGLDLTGVPLLGIWNVPDARRVASILDTQHSAAEPALLASEFSSVRRRRGELLVAALPFYDRTGERAMLGAIVATPSLPEGLDRIASVKLTTERRAPASATGVPDPVRRELETLARRRGDGRANPFAARDLREMGGIPIQPVR